MDPVSRRTGGRPGPADAAGATVRILYLVNNPDFFLSHRLPVALGAVREGFEVHVATPAKGDIAAITSRGMIHHPIRMDRSRGLPWREARTLWDILRLYRRLRPALVHQVTIKPVLYGTLAARIARVPAVVNAVSGIGYAFIGTAWRDLVLRTAVSLIYRAALRHPNQRVIFQNEDDRELFVRRRFVRRGDGVMIRGSGADTGFFRPHPEPGDRPKVVLASRMLWDKGVGEFVEAARELKRRGVAADFLLVGDPDPGNPASIPVDRLEAWRAEGAVSWQPFRRDMDAVFRECHVVCLPSYREGLPKVLIEAAAAGKPIVTTDVPGCRDAVLPGETGLLAPPRDAAGLAAALLRLVEDGELRARMGRRAREMAVADFSVERIVDEHLDLYRRLTAR